MSTFTWLQFSAAKSALASRLSSSTSTTDAERGAYLIEALRTWNALTESWAAEFNFLATSAAAWYNLGTLAGSPRLRSVTDANLYTMMQYQLLEPPTGAETWTGTTQFSLSDLQYSLQYRCQEVIQASGCNLAQSTIASTVNSRRFIMPDSVLEPRRIRFIPASGLGSTVTLTREDSLTFDDFEPTHLQETGMPASWAVASQPPLAVDMDIAPNVPGQYDLISLNAGPTFAPPASTLLGVPDDWGWLPKWGALADVLSKSPESSDKQRADYCLARYMQGMKLMAACNWLLQATITGEAVETPSVYEQDSFDPEWEENTSAWPSVISAAMDIVAPCPVMTGGNTVSVGMTVVGNIPVPSSDTDYVQCSRDAFDAILAYAQHLASFKMGGEEFSVTMSLLQDFLAAVQQTNKRLSTLGILNDMLAIQGRRQDLEVPRS